MNEFKVGDLIRGRKNTYRITNENMYLGKVIRKSRDEILIKVLKHNDYFEIGKEYWVCNTSHDFELVNDNIGILKRDIAKLEKKLNKKKKQLEELQCKPILDDVEREYLKAVIRPFEKEIIEISKETTNNFEYIYIKMKDWNDSFCLPNFKKGTMYKGMKTDKEYTLKELNLDE